MIQISAASKLFHAGTANELLALDNINLEIAASEFLVIVGSNGSGKSTLLNAIAGDILLSEGEIIIDKINCTRLAAHQRSKFIARVFQNPLQGTASDLSILDNFRLASIRSQIKGLHIGNNNFFHDKVYEKIKSLGMGLESKLQQPIGLLSGGQRQALTLLMAVMDQTKILLLDEPTAALDPKSAALVMEKTKQLVEEFQLCAILITHEMKFAQAYGTRLIQMSQGKIIRDINQSQRKNLSTSDIYTWFA